MGWDFSKPAPAHNVTDPWTRAVQQMAYHCGVIMDPTTFKGSCSVGVRVFHYRIEPHPRSPGVWDTVYLRVDDGPEFCCGNRCGGRDTLAALYAEDLRSLL